MAVYPKIWTTILHEPWFKALNCTERGAFLQLILLIRDSKNDGQIWCSSAAEMSGKLRLHRLTWYKIAAHLSSLGLIEIREMLSGEVLYIMPKYLIWQGLGPKDVDDRMRKSAADLRQNCAPSYKSIKTIQSQGGARNTDEETDFSNPPKEKKDEYNGPF